ncbi:MAG TPA: DUF2851 family protein [Flavobacteriales bacterium]|nr:DUF2851 family protein [Flavobacteriales bacterium]HPH82435.1 DUF2851 family protein [Flavobacteriales bacterium]
MISEQLLHFIWKFRLYQTDKLALASGESLEVISPGTHNKHSGPDFQNARIKIGNTLWAGNVELHIRSSDWYRHKHETDAAYHTVILHVVAIHDMDVFDLNNQVIPVIELKSFIKESLLQRWEELSGSMFPIPCAALGRPDVITMQNWLDRLVTERLEEKSSRIRQLLSLTKNDWTEALYCFIFRSVGMQLNAVPFELLARSTPYRILLNYKQSQFQLEALLYGQSGLLHSEHEDEYLQALWNEYRFLARKHKLKPIEKHLWKFLRLRPMNFPTVRISQLANLISKHSISPENFREMGSLKEWVNWFDMECSPYWDEHYVMDHFSTKKKKHFGKSASQSLLMNAIVPFLFVYATHRGDEELRDRVLEVLYQLPPEKNVILEVWNQFGIQPDTAAASQGLIQLKTNYCDSRRCLECAVGHRLLKEETRREPLSSNGKVPTF